MCECFRSHLLRVGLLGRQRAGLFVQRLDDGPVAADLLRHVLVLLHQSLSGELVVADVHAGDDPQHVQHPRVDVVGVGLQREGEEFNVMLPDTETATWNMKFRPLISLSFHLELVLVAGLLQTSFTDRRETLQSRPLLLQQEGRKDGRKERRKEGGKEGRKEGVRKRCNSNRRLWMFREDLYENDSNCFRTCCRFLSDKRRQAISKSQISAAESGSVSIEITYVNRELRTG